MSIKSANNGNPYAVVTGASQGIGRDIALQLDRMGYPLVLVSRNLDALEIVRDSLILSERAVCVVADLSKQRGITTLLDAVDRLDVSIFVNNAGFGQFGEFSDTPIDIDLNMIDLNIKAVHMLTKYFLKKFRKKSYQCGEHTHILNVASVAGLMRGGPMMSTYYASKSYVVSLSEAIYYELKRRKSNVSVSLLCPGPVETGFNRRAGTDFIVKGKSSHIIAKIAVDGMFKRKLYIVPGFLMKATVITGRLLPSKLVLAGTYFFQNKKSQH